MNSALSVTAGAPNNYLYPYISAGNFFWASANLLKSYNSISTVVATLIQSGIPPSIGKVAKSVMVSTLVSEVQSVTVTTLDGLLFGGFNVDFNSSGIPVYFRVDESAEDFETKLESLPTVGDVEVNRTLVKSPEGRFMGFQAIFR
jgi:hypothetical protein